MAHRKRTQKKKHVRKLKGGGESHIKPNFPENRRILRGATRKGGKFSFKKLGRSIKRRVKKIERGIKHGTTNTFLKAASFLPMASTVTSGVGGLVLGHVL